jgi:hypothetical protein
MLKEASGVIWEGDSVMYRERLFEKQNLKIYILTVPYIANLNSRQS